MSTRDAAMIEPRIPLTDSTADETAPPRRGSGERQRLAMEACAALTQAGLDKPELLYRAAIHAMAIAGVECAGVGALSGDEIVFGTGPVFESAPMRLHVSASLSGEVLRSRRTFVCNDAIRETHQSMVAAARLRLGSLLLLPLEHRGRVLGVLMLGSARSNAFVDDDVQTLELVAATLAGAITSAEAFAERELLVAEVTAGMDRVTKSEAWFRALNEHSSELIHITDPNGVFVYNSPSTGRILGYGPDDLRGRNVEELIHPDDVHMARTCLTSLREQVGGTCETIVRMRHRDGDWRYVEGHCRNLLDVPAVRGIVCNARDVTARVNATRSIEFQAQLLEIVGQAVIATDLDGKVIYWNRAATEMYGWQRNEVLGQQLRDLVVTPALAAQAERIMAQLLEGRSWSGEFELRRRDGSTFLALVTDSPIYDAQHRMIGIVGTSSDLTLRRELEKQLQQAQKMEAIGQLAGGVAHDFNNMLTVITSYGEMLLDELGDSPQREDVLEIRRAARRAAELTGQLLAFSRKQVMRVEPLDLGEVVRSVEKMLRRVIHESILFDVICPTETATVMADRTQIEQVLMNLVVNARDAMSDGGHLRVQVERQAERQVVVLRVLDTGCGMTEQVRSRIFEPFFTTKEEGRGTGLGLAVVYGIIKQLGGVIDVVSAPGQGTEFTIELPLIGGVPLEAETEERTVNVGTETVLLVEDNEPLAQIAQRVLERLGYTVLTASNGAEALTRVMTEPRPQVDLLVTDVVMPQCSGPDLVRQLATRGLQPAVLYMSGYADPAAYAADLDGDASFLAKPWTPYDLAQAVRRALDRTTALAA